MPGRAKARVDGHSERFCNDLPPARAYLLQEALIAGWQNIPGKLDELHCRRIDHGSLIR
ncbi:MAG TPA: hypothetical protein VIJ39_13680 [Solirubrobacteraceae bacterium]